jgi:cytochrome c-type biogenesis protein CcmH
VSALRVNRRIGWIVLGLVAVALLVVGAREDPTEGSSEDRLFAIAGQLKCVQCIGENVANSQAPIAVEMRGEIRRQMQAGASDDEIFSTFADSYGESVLLNPSGTGFAALIWVIPVVAVGIGLLGVGLVFTRARRDPVDTTVDDADRELVERARRERRP